MASMVADAWVRFQALEAAFHPHVASTSPFNLSTRDFLEAMWLPLVTTAAYVGAFSLGIRSIEDAKAWDMRLPLACWNFFLAAFSVCGTARTLPFLARNVATYPFRRSLCHAAADDWGQGRAGLWVQLFILSKFAELLDTAFIVLRKKRLLFLHWYHHVTVLLYCWHSYATEAPHALYFVAMNYAVHSVMYLYYGLMAIDRKPAWFAPEVVTGAQITQMVVGVGVQYAAARARCGVDTLNLLAGSLMYASYLALFVKFAVERFVLKSYKRHEVIRAVAGQARQGQSQWADAMPWTKWLVRGISNTIRRVASFPKMASP